jgi:fido (protein-threonine AMPylation protein)
MRWPLLSDADRVKGLAQLIGVVIARFIHIHPFLNGNGRVSRLLWAVLLWRFGLPQQVSVVRHPGGSYDSIMASAMKGDYAPAVHAVLIALMKKRVPRTLPAPAIEA